MNKVFRIIVILIVLIVLIAIATEPNRATAPCSAFDGKNLPARCN